MKHLLRDLGLILGLAGLWALSGYLMGIALEIFVASFGVNPYPYGIILASVNVIIGMLLFKGVTRDPTAEHIFFRGVDDEGEGDIRVGCLWALPLSLLLIGLYSWFIAILLRLIFPR